MVASARLMLLLPITVERTVVFETADGLKLEGTLALPSGNLRAKRSKALLFVAGSGPTDRNGNQPGLQTDLLKSLAADLASRGLVTLRYDKRAVRSNAAQWPKDVAKLGRDRVAGLALLATAGRNYDFRTPSSFSTAGRNYDFLLREQIGAALDAKGIAPAARSEVLANLAESMDYVMKNGARPPNVLPGLAALFGPGTAQYWQSVLSLDPTTLLADYRGNVLIVQGASDGQISASLDFPALLRTARRRAHGHTRPRSCPSPRTI